VVPPPQEEKLGGSRFPRKPVAQGQRFKRKAMVVTTKHVVCTHRRIITGKQPESATIEVSLAAAAAHAVFLPLGLTLDIEQVKPTPDNGSPATAGVNGFGITEIKLSLVHAQKGLYATKTATNDNGEQGVRATANALLLGFVLPDFQKWLTA
jgi:hypothetical protein